MKKEIIELQVNHGDLPVVFGDYDRNLTIPAILQCLAKCCTIVDEFMVLKLEVDTRDADNISLFFSTSTELNAALYAQVVETLSEQFRYASFKGGSLGSRSSTGHGEGE